MSKYNDFMSHIRVDDEMHRRVMDAVSKAIKEENHADPAQVGPIRPDVSANTGETAPVRRKAKVSLIKGLSIAAASVLVAGGAMFLAARFFAGSGATKSMAMFENAPAQTVADGAAGVAGDNNIKSAVGAPANVDSAKREETVEGIAPETTVESVEAEEDGKDIRKDNGMYTDAPGERVNINSMFPFKAKTSRNGFLNGSKIKMNVFTGENGEEAVIFSADEGTDIVKVYYPDFKGIPALLKTKGGQEFYAIDISAGEGKQVSGNGPFDAVAWTKNGRSYMIAFSTKADIGTFVSLIDKF